MFGLAAGTVAPSAWAGLWQAAVERRGSLPKNALPRPQRAGCPQEPENQSGDGKTKGLRPLLHLTPSPASHPIPCIPPHLLHPTPSLIPACPQGGRLGLGTGVSTTLGSEGEGLVTDVLYLRKAEGSREEKPRDAHSMGGLSTGAEA